MIKRFSGGLVLLLVCLVGVLLVGSLLFCFSKKANKVPKGSPSLEKMAEVPVVKEQKQVKNPNKGVEKDNGIVEFRGIRTSLSFE